MVGREVVDAGRALGWDVVGRTRAELDVTDRAAVQACVTATGPDLVVNAAAYTQVDAAETEGELARQVDAEGPARLAEACRVAEASLVQLSTDYVFDGRARRPYRPEDRPHPLGVYGRTKWEGEEAVRQRLPRHLIVRTSWVYASHGHNFFRTIARLAREQETLRVVADQHGCPTLAADLARALLDGAAIAMTRPNGWGTYHFCNGGATTGMLRVGDRRRARLAARHRVPEGGPDHHVRHPRPQPGRHTRCSTPAPGQRSSVRPRATGRRRFPMPYAK